MDRDENVAPMLGIVIGVKVFELIRTYFYNPADHTTITRSPQPSVNMALIRYSEFMQETQML